MIGSSPPPKEVITNLRCLLSILDLIELESFSPQDELEQKCSCLKLRSLCFLMVRLKTKARQKGVEKNKIQLKNLSGPKLFDKDHFISHTKESMS